MRLWSVHPKYLDTVGLVALWREGLLAKKVLEGKTIGYKNHPQLLRFKTKPLSYINFYLHCICDEALARGYKFDRTKLTRRMKIQEKIPVSEGQLNYEWMHLQKKLYQRDRRLYFKNKSEEKILEHDLFVVIPGAIESWEIIK